MDAKRLVAILLMVGLVGALVAVALGGAGGPPPDEGYVRQPVHWYLLEIDGQDVLLAYSLVGAAAECERQAEGTVSELEDRVVLTAFKEVTTDAVRPCTDEIAIVDARVTLSEPLGDRALVGCRPRMTDPSEDEICRDLDRSDEVGVLDLPRG